MGRSGVGCLKMIACGGGGGDSVDRDDLEYNHAGENQNKGSDKRGWSFRKRSESHRVLKSTVVAEVTSSESKKIPEPAIANFQVPAHSDISEKACGVQLTNEVPQLSTFATESATTPATEDYTTEDSATKDCATEYCATKDCATEYCATKDCATEYCATEDYTNLDVSPDESVIIVIQAAVRGFLARRQLLKQKNVVKLQAAIRGHLVRRRAVGTLRCVQAIIKMQHLVRARQAHLYARQSGIEMKGTKDLGAKPHPTYVSTEKLLSNRFAQLLLESTPRTKHINIKCDTSHPDSTWIWLDRWMAVSPTETTESHTPESCRVSEEENEAESPKGHVERKMLSEDRESTDVKSSVIESAVKSDSKEDSMYEHSSSISILNVELPKIVNTSLDSKENSDFLPNEICQPDSNPSAEPEMEAEKKQNICSAKRVTSEQTDSEGRKFAFGLRKASNPAFVAAQSKFEELASVSSSKSFGLSAADSSDAISSAPNDSVKREIDMIETSSSLLNHVGGSECGTELSVTSTLDSPDHSEVGNVEFVKETKVLEQLNGNHLSSNNLHDDEKLEHAILGTELAYSVSDKPEEHASSNGLVIETTENVASAVFPVVEQKLENVTFANIELEPDKGHSVYKSSPEGSPRSHMTVPESQGTPSSQISTNTKKTKSDKKGSSHKRKSLSANKRSPINASLDSSVSNRLTQLAVEHKSSKRRNSFGSPKPDHGDQEPRDSSCSNSIPSYMQATESARAKALASSSPRSSPDVQDKEIKKRHSLPGANGRHGSPHIQRSNSQQLHTKANGTQERKWQR